MNEERPEGCEIENPIRPSEKENSGGSAEEQSGQNDKNVRISDQIKVIEIKEEEHVLNPNEKMKVNRIFNNPEKCLFLLRPQQKNGENIK